MASVQAKRFIPAWLVLCILPACFGDFNSHPVTPPDGDTDTAVDSDGTETLPDGVTVRCGNGVVEGGEECDDGNDEEGDGCENDCTFTCREDLDCFDNNVCNGDETCDAVAHMCAAGRDRANGSVCLDDPRRICLDGACTDSVCGDGFLDTGGGEMCEPPDQGTCDSACMIRCMSDGDCPDDGNPCNGEEFCDPGSGTCDRRNPPTDGTECGTDPRRICIEHTCQESTCGDGFLDAAAGEECDDGRNGDNEDGCRDDCAYTCHENGDCDDGHACTDNLCDADGMHLCVHPVSDSGTVCRAADGVCDVAEACDGHSMDCPLDGFAARAVVCRPAEGPCDVAENCTGTSSDCPSDGFEPASTECRASAGPCDRAERCTGSSADCPANGFEPASTECRASTGPCDPAETCTGTSAACPADGSLSFSNVTPVSATASSIYDGGYPANNARDGSTGTFWWSAAGTPPQWIYFDLGGPRCVDSVRGYFSAALGTLIMDVQVSDDASSWTTVYSGWHPTIMDWLSVSFSQTRARYVRLYQTSLVFSMGNCAEFQAHQSNL
jgi:cysteine-rich repeat protein